MYDRIECPVCESDNIRYEYDNIGGGRKLILVCVDCEHVLGDAVDFYERE